jgi:DNA-binding PadR family transcriptional regulator
MPRVFGHGGLRLVLLSLLEDGPKTGYELIVALEERFLGMYRPSSGTVYPRLAALEEEGLIVSGEEGGKRVYQITDRGRDELARRRSELEDAVSRATTTVRAVIDDLQTDIRAAVTAVQTEVRRQASSTGDARHIADDVRRATQDAVNEARRASEDARRVATEEARRVRRLADDLRRQAGRERHHASTAASSTRQELDDLASEVSAWASEAREQLRRYLPDEGQRDRLRTALADARRAFVDTLTRSDHESDST